MAKLTSLSATFQGVPLGNLVLLVGLAGDYDSLVALAPIVTPAKTLFDELKNSGETDRAKNLKAAIDLAGSFAELVQFRPLSNNNLHLLKLLRAMGKARLAAFVPIAENAVTILDLLEVTDVNNLLTVMTANPKADLATLRPIVIKAKVTGGPRVDPMHIRFTQATCTNYGVGYTVQANIERLKSQPAWDIPGGAIRVFQKTKAMNSWGAVDGDYGRADARYLEDDQIYTLDNRRLVAYQRAGRQIPAPVFVPNPTARAEMWKFTTGTGARRSRSSEAANRSAPMWTRLTPDQAAGFSAWRPSRPPTPPASSTNRPTSRAPAPATTAPGRCCACSATPTRPKS